MTDSNLPSSMRRHLSGLAKQFGVAAVYALLAHIGHLFFESHVVANIFEPASGWALAALLVGGMRYAWGLFIGALLIHAVSGLSLLVDISIALGNTLGAILGVWMLGRDTSFNSRIRSLRDYIQLVLLGGTGYSIGTLMGGITLLVFGGLELEAFLIDLPRWWMGDVLGIILIAPLFLVWRLEKNDWLEMRQSHHAYTALFVLGLTFLAGQVIFLEWFNDSVNLNPRGYVMFLFIALVAMLLGTWGTMLALVMTATQALLGAHRAIGFFANDIAATQLVNYWMYMAILSVVGMALATYIAELRLAERQLRELSTHLQEVREEEKAGIAREIHDDLGGTLTALKMETYCLARELPACKNQEPLLERIESMSQLLDDAVSVTRRVITELRPTILDDLGLLAAIEWQAAQFQKRTGIVCRVNCIEEKGTLDKPRSIALFRIFQEALTNISRHSHATRVEVEFHHDKNEVWLSICDNGCGIKGGHIVTRNSCGIRGMFERVGQLGGKIKFSSPPGRGLNVAVTLPLPANQQAEGTT